MPIRIMFQNGSVLMLEGEDNKAIKRVKKGWYEGKAMGGAMSGHRVMWREDKVMVIDFQSEEEWKKEKEKEAAEIEREQLRSKPEVKLRVPGGRR